MTLEEKARLVVGLEREFFPPTNNGIPGRTTPSEKYGIPSLALADGTSGVRLSRTGAEKSTAFPANATLASSWDVSLAREAAEAVAYEAFGYGVNVMLAPGMNIIRNPLCGRNFEYYSEDPFLSGKLAAAYVGGLQSMGVGACVKHFTCNVQETNRGNNNVLVSERALREIYLKGFETCIREAKPWTLMSAYNQVNGTPVQEQWELLTGILRNEWGFDGVVMTDWSIVPHNTAAQVHAGNDLLMPGRERQVQEVIEAVRSGALSEKDLDLAVIRLMALAERCGSPRGQVAPDLERGREIARKISIESSVLLENNGMLPLPEVGKAALFGVRSYNLVARGAGAAFVQGSGIKELYSAFKAGGVEIDTELEDLYLKYVDFASADIGYNEKIKVHIGLPLLPELEISRTLAEKTAERCDYAVITLGRTASEGEDWTLEDYYLSDTEKELLRTVCDAFHAKGKKVAVVLNIAGMIEAASWKDLPDAILNIWLPGQEGGEAAFELLSGKANPSGRLAVSYANDYFDWPSALDFPYDSPESGRNYDYTEFNEGIYVGYRHFCTRGVPVLWPFGYGLSYTTFAYSNLKVRTCKDGISVSFTVTNTGGMEGKEAVGVYVTAPSGAMDKPSVELKAFAKTASLASGESETIRFTIPLASLASYNENTGKWETARGEYALCIGADVTRPVAQTCIKIRKVK